MTFAGDGVVRDGGKLAVVLAGGCSLRMGGRDKAEVRLGGIRLIDHVVERLRPQADQIIIAGPHDYESGLEFLPDARDAPEGPAAAVYTVHKRLSELFPGAEGFTTVPVDGPFLPADLVERFTRTGTPAIASDGEQDHPTFAYWMPAVLTAAWHELRGKDHLSLRALSRACGARRIVWRERGCFFNVNTPEDLESANRMRTL